MTVSREGLHLIVAGLIQRLGDLVTGHALQNCRQKCNAFFGWELVNTRKCLKCLNESDGNRTRNLRIDSPVL